MQPIALTKRFIMPSSTARIEMRVNPDIKLEAERAAALLGMKSLTEFITQAIQEKTRAVIQNHQQVVLSNDVFDQFYAACNADSKPSKALQSLADKVDEQGYR